NRVARSRHRRLDPHASRALPRHARRHDADRLAQHGRGGAPVRAGDLHEAGTDRGRRCARALAATLRPRHVGGGFPRRRARARRKPPGGTVNGAAQIMFSPRRVAAMVLRYWYLLRSSWARLTELIYWPTVQMLMWGFLQTYLSQQSSAFARAGGVLV